MVCPECSGDAFVATERIEIQGPFVINTQPGGELPPPGFVCNHCGWSAPK